jgi:hypothetical protein
MRPSGDLQHLGSSPRQCAKPCIAASERVSGETNHGNTSPTSLQPRPDPARLFFLFPRLKSSLKGHHFGTVKNMHAAVTNALKEIPVQDFHASYDTWQNRWQWCIDDQLCYFEEY